MTESDDCTWFSMVLSTSGAKAGIPQIEFSGAHFVDFWSQGLKMFKSTLLEFILVTSGAKQGLEMLKSTFLELILSTSGAKA